MGAFVIGLMLAMIAVGFVVALLMLPAVVLVQAVRGRAARPAEVRRNVRVRVPLTSAD